MKKFIPTYIILILFAGLFIFYHWSEKKEKPKDTQIFKVEKDKITEITLEDKETKEKVVLKKENKEWKMLEPHPWEVDQEKINEMVEELSTLEAERAFKEGEVKLEECGLKEPTYAVHFKAEEKTHTLLVGKKSPIGYQYYVKKEDSPTVYILAGYTLDKFKKSALDLRERRIVKFEVDEVKKLALAYPENKIVIEKKDDKWEITSPLKTDGDKWNIEDFLRDLKNLKAKEFIEDDAKDLSKYGLDNPPIKIELWLGKDMAYKGVNFGKTEEDIVYACRAGLNTVYGLDKDKAEKLRKDLFYFRNKVMLSFSFEDVKGLVLSWDKFNMEFEKKEEKWIMKKPEEKETKEGEVENILWTVKELEASSFEAEEAKDLKPYGLDKPQLTLTLKLKDGEKTLYIGKEIKKDDEERVYAKVKDKPQIFTVQKYVLDDLKKKPEDFLEKEEKKETQEN
ncbi:DUF4340 domain-containing protein [Candidatus Calescamantes bacterium]|nr:DUF4340 domain-containing protein [Candidatus Calescamantes bacterium]